MKSSTAENEEPNRPTPARARSRISQTEIPGHTVEDALRIPQAIADNYGKRPAKPLAVARAMGYQPGTGTFRTLTGAAIAYGFTEGGYNADVIALTDLGRRAVAPAAEGDDLLAKRAGFLKPSIIGAFMRQYDNSPLPKPQIGQNVLEELGVPASRTKRAWDVIVDGAAGLGLLMDINGKKYVDLAGASSPPESAGDVEPEAEDLEQDGEGQVLQLHGGDTAPPDGLSLQKQPAEDPNDRRVFITHGKKRKIAEQLKEILSFGEFEPVMSVERETTAKPVPKKVMGDMRECGAAIIHVSAEQQVLDQEGKHRVMLNENVLIEIGAAMALYDERFILLVEDGITLPSNVKGLYEVRYEGTELGQAATMKLLKALRGFKRDDGQEAA